MTRTVDDAIDWLEEQSAAGTDFGAGYCLKVQRTGWDVPAKYSTAWLSGQHAEPLLPTPPPRGAIGYWSGGGSGAGHIVTFTGDPDVGCWTTDFLRTGKLDRVPLEDINRAWVSLEYQGWGRIINDVVVLPEHGGEGAGDPIGDEFDMASLTDLENVVRKVLNEGTGNGQSDWAGTSKATLGAAQATFNAASALPLGTWRIKLPDADAQYLITGGARVWIKSQQALGELGADTVPLEIVAADDTRWSFPLVGPDAPG